MSRRKAFTVAILLVWSVLPISLQADTGWEAKTHHKAVAYSVVPTVGFGLAGAGLIAYGSEKDRSDLAVTAGVSLVTLGLVLGPSGGHIYAERSKPFTGAALRLGLLLVTATGVVAGIAHDMDHNETKPAHKIVIGVGAIGLAASAIYDIITVGNSVDSFNNRYEAIGWQIAPTFFAEEKALGATVRLSF